MVFSVLNFLQFCICFYHIQVRPNCLIPHSAGRLFHQYEIISGSHIGKRILLPRIALCTTPDSGLPFTLRRRQFPIRPCFAMTINKAQGQTLRFVGLHLPQHVFSHGQLYVALSRVCSAQCISVYVDGTIPKNKGVFMRNVVLG